MALKIAIVLNPASGRGRGARLRASLQNQFPDSLIHQTRGSLHAIELAREAAHDGAQIVVAAGGDGTLGEVLNGIWGTRARLGVLPLGTGNDFARCIGVGTRLESAIEVVKSGKSRAIDVGRVEIGNQTRYFLNVAGAGFDSSVAARINEHRPRILSKMSGTSAYLVAALSEMRAFPLAQMRLTMDEKTVATRAVLCAIANAQSYGGGMRVAPDADLDDGLFDICLIKELGKLQFMRAFPSVFSGQHIHHPKVEMFKTTKIRLESEPPLPVLVDGEIMGQTPATFEIVARAVEVLMPIADKT